MSNENAVGAMLRKRLKKEREADLAFIAEAIQKGEKRTTVFERLVSMRPYVITQGMVDGDFREIESRWVTVFIKGQTLANLKSRELARLEMLEDEAWQAWQRSKSHGQVEKFNVVGGTPGKEKSVTAIKRDGDPKFLELLLKYSEHRAKLLGLFAPIKIDADAESNLKSTEELEGFRKAYLDVLAAQQKNKCLPMIKNATVIPEPVEENG